jgi:hypothetical protein
MSELSERIIEHSGHSAEGRIAIPTPPKAVA